MHSTSAVRWLGLLLPLVAAIGVFSTAPVKSGQRIHQPPLLPRAGFVRAIAAGHRQMAADYYWLQTIQATGQAGTAEEYRDIYDYANLVTDIDPDWERVYVFSAPSVTYNRGREQWVNTDESTKLLEKGLGRFPQHLLLRILYAYNLSFFHKEYVKAAQQLELAAKLPGAPPYIPSLITRLYAQAGDIDSGLAFAQTLIDTTEDPETRATFEHRILELNLERSLRDVDQAIARFRAREGRAPKDLDELVARGDLSEKPEDPLGGTIVIGEDGRASSTAQGRRLHLFLPEGARP